MGVISNTHINLKCSLLTCGKKNKKNTAHLIKTAAENRKQNPNTFNLLYKLRVKKMIKGSCDINFMQKFLCLFNKSR